MTRILTKPGYRFIAEAMALAGGITGLSFVLSLMALPPG
jgi:hypothetical protein